MRTDKREEFKNVRYAEAAERDARAGLGGWCVQCFVGVRGGSYLATDHHEIISKAELPGLDNLQVLFSLQNIGLACRPHHSELGHLRRLWLGAMVKAGLARVDDYRVAPFAAHWDDRAYPPTMECLGDYEYGTRYYQSEKLAASLDRVNRCAIPDFDAHQYCSFCPHRSPCQALTRLRARKEHADELNAEAEPAHPRPDGQQGSGFPPS